MDKLRALREKGRQSAVTCADDYFFIMLTMFVLGLLVHTVYIHVLILGFTWYAFTYTIVIGLGTAMAYREYMKVWHSRI